MMFKKEAKDLKEIVEWLKKGNILCTETDTTIGFCALNEEVLYESKKRDRNKKFIKFINISSLLEILSPIQIKFMSEFWPGRTTLIINKIAYRNPTTFLINQLLHHVDSMYSTSANISGCLLHKTIEDVYEEFKDNDKIMYVNKTLKDKIISNIPSTIVDIDEWKILRYGDTAKDVDNFFERYINVQK